MFGPALRQAWACGGGGRPPPGPPVLPRRRTPAPAGPDLRRVRRRSCRCRARPPARSARRPTARPVPVGNHLFRASGSSRTVVDPADLGRVATCCRRGGADTAQWLDPHPADPQLPRAGLYPLVQRTERPRPQPLELLIQPSDRPAAQHHDVVEVVLSRPYVAGWRRRAEVFPARTSSPAAPQRRATGCARRSPRSPLRSRPGSWSVALRRQRPGRVTSRTGSPSGAATDRFTAPRRRAARDAVTSPMQRCREAPAS